MTPYKRKQSWDREEEQLCRAVKRLHTTSNNRELSTESSEDDAGSPVCQLAAYAKSAQQQSDAEHHGPAPPLSQGISMPESSTPASPTVTKGQQGFSNDILSSTSPIGRMSLGKSREDTPDPRAVPEHFNKGTPAMDTTSPQQLQTTTLVSATSLWRYRRPASAAASLASGKQQDRAQHEPHPGTSVNLGGMQSSMPLDGIQASIPEHPHAEQHSSSCGGQPVDGPAASAGKQWTLKFMPQPQQIPAVHRAASIPSGGLPGKQTSQAAALGRSGSEGHLQPQPAAMVLPRRLQSVQLSGSPGSIGSGEIEEPLTPGRTERSTGTTAQQRSASQSSYDSLYEEANNLLKNLHFQRLLRHIPESPEPAEKSAAFS